jgi:hypothetical protein
MWQVGQRQNQLAGGALDFCSRVILHVGTRAGTNWNT